MRHFMSKMCFWNENFYVSWWKCRDNKKKVLNFMKLRSKSKQFLIQLDWKLAQNFNFIGHSLLEYEMLIEYMRWIVYFMKTICCCEMLRVNCTRIHSNDERRRRRSVKIDEAMSSVTSDDDDQRIRITFLLGEFPEPSHIFHSLV